MREIKFRGKKTDTGEWVYGYLFQGKEDEKTKYAFILRDDLYIDGKYIPDRNVLFTRNQISIADINTVGQFTGLTDKTGKEIYEGDLIERTGLKRIGQVYFTNGCFYAMFEGFAAPLYQLVAEYEIKIVGNIYQEPEKRIVDTAFGKMLIEDDVAISVGDIDCHYSLPFKEMTDKEIIKHFEDLYEGNQ